MSSHSPQGKLQVFVRVEKQARQLRMLYFFTDASMRFPASKKRAFQPLGKGTIIRTL